MNRFKKMVTSRGMDNRINILGWQDREATSALLQMADIFVLPSRNEAMPVAVLEALAHRIPVITTHVGVIPEFLEHGTNALVIEPGAVEELVDALQVLLEHREERERLGAAGHQVFLEKLDIAAVADRLLRLYRTIGDDHGLGLTVAPLESR